MAVLNFTKQSNGYWRADATAYADFAVQLNRADSGRVIISRSFINDSDKEAVFAEHRGKTFTQSFEDNIYPQYLHIESESEVTHGEIIEAE